MAALNLVLAPFLTVFLFTYFFLRNAEKFYHHPSSVGARRWSSLAKWRLREFNELPHYLNHRCGPCLAPGDTGQEGCKTRPRPDCRPS